MYGNFIKGKVIVTVKKNPNLSASGTESSAMRKK